MQPCHDGLAQAGARDFSQLRSRPRLVQFLIETVSVAEGLHEPHGHFRRGLFRVENFAPHMRQAGRRAAGFPVEEGLATRCAARPEIT